MVREGPPEPAPETRIETAPYPAEKARGGKIILSQPWQRLVFIAGLVGMFLLVIVLAVFAMR
jgi:hypothetical protein